VGAHRIAGIMNIADRTCRLMDRRCSMAFQATAPRGLIFLTTRTATTTTLHRLRWKTVIRTQGLTSEEGVTLVFKDGRAPVQIHDYVLTRNTVYVWDRHQRVIPIDQIDMVATAKANQEAGIDFELPEAAR